MLGKLGEFGAWFFGRRQNEDWRSWRSLVIVFPFVIGIFLIAPQAISEKESATRQQTAQGTVTSYEKSNHNLCGYIFSVGKKSYKGESSAPRTDLKIGDQVLVYIDSQNANINSLEDFAAMGDRDIGFAEMLLVFIFIVAASISVFRFTAARAGAGSKST